MSRTYRRKQPKEDLFWHMRNYDAETVTPPQVDPKSKEGKQRLARYRSDGHRNHKELGPAWYRRIFVEVPQRRNAQRQLQRVVRGEEFEVLLNAKEPLRYWT